MNTKRNIGITLMIVGIGLMGASYYIKRQVEEGKIEISGAQKKVDTTNWLFSLSPTTKQLGDGLTDSAQKKINEGKQEVLDYQTLAGKLMIGGIIVAVFGVVLAIWGRQKTR